MDRILVFDQGKILMQYTCEVEKNETVLSLEQKIHDLEMRYFPEAISKLIAPNHVSKSSAK